MADTNALRKPRLPILPKRYAQFPIRRKLTISLPAETQRSCFLRLVNFNKTGLSEQQIAASFDQVQLMVSP